MVHMEVLLHHTTMVDQQDINMEREVCLDLPQSSSSCRSRKHENGQARQPYLVTKRVLRRLFMELREMGSNTVPILERDREQTREREAWSSAHRRFTQ